MKTPQPITDPELRQRIEWHIEAMRAKLDGTAGDGDFEAYSKASHQYIPTDWSPVGCWYPDVTWYRLKPKPRLRPFTPEEARQLVGAVVVSDMGRRIVLLEMDDDAFVLRNGDRIMLDEHSTELWKWKWPHESDDALRPFWKEEAK